MKRTIALALAVLMCAGLFAACSTLGEDVYKRQSAPTAASAPALTMRLSSAINDRGTAYGNRISYREKQRAIPAPVR